MIADSKQVYKNEQNDLFHVMINRLKSICKNKNESEENNHRIPKLKLLLRLAFGIDKLNL